LLELKENNTTKTNKAPIDIEALTHRPIETSKSNDNRFKIGTNGVFLFSPSDNSPFGALELSFSFLLPIPLSFEFAALLSILSKNIEANSSSSTVDMALFRAWMDYIFLQKKQILASLGIGSGLATIWTKGSSKVNANVKTENISTAFFGIRGNLFFVVAPNIRIRLGANIGFIAPKAGIYFANERVSGIGPSLLETTIGLQMCF